MCRVTDRHRVRLADRGEIIPFSCHLTIPRDKTIGPGQSREPVEGQGSALKPARRLCPLDPQQRARPFAIYQLGFVLRGGPTVTYQGPCRPSPENKPINGFQGPLPLAE